jgi:hypothetical protein
MNTDEERGRQIKRGLAWAMATHALSDLATHEYGRPAHDELAQMLHDLRMLQGEEIKRERFVEHMNHTEIDTTP